LFHVGLILFLRFLFDLHRTPASPISAHCALLTAHTFTNCAMMASTHHMLLLLLAFVCVALSLSPPSLSSAPAPTLRDNTTKPCDDCVSFYFLLFYPLGSGPTFLCSAPLSISHSPPSLLPLFRYKCINST